LRIQATEPCISLVRLWSARVVRLSYNNKLRCHSDARLIRRVKLGCLLLKPRVPLFVFFPFDRRPLIMHESDHETGSAPTRLKLVGSPLVSNKGARKPESAASSELGHSHQHPDQADSTLLEELPIFQRHNESTAIELFYDLFFVANLATFSNIHEIQSVSTLTSYIGFFCVLWFTWCLTSMHDIRFVSDSLSSRIAKGAHLGVMVGLAVAGPKYASEGHPAELRVLGNYPIQPIRSIALLTSWQRSFSWCRGSCWLCSICSSCSMSAHIRTASCRLA